MDSLEPLKPPNAGRHPDRTVPYQVGMSRDEYLKIRTIAATRRIPLKEVCREFLEPLLLEKPLPKYNESSMVQQPGTARHTIQISLRPEEPDRIRYRARQYGTTLQNTLRHCLQFSIQNYVDLFD